MVKNRLLMDRAIVMLAATLAGALAPLMVNAETDDQPRPEVAERGPVIELESRVTGNREQPQVFYLVPWQTPESPALHYDPLSSQLQQVFGHLERDELRRQLDGSAAQEPSRTP